MTQQLVSGHYRKNQRGRRILISRYKRRKRASTTKKRMISPKPVRLYQIRDEYGQIRGFSSKPPRKA